MPRIAKFNGIKIYMYHDDASRHHLPHIHAEYQGKIVVVALKNCRVLDGRLPPARLRMVLGWMEFRRKELLADWELAIGKKKLFNVEPLR